MSVSLEGLHPYVKAKVEELLKNANARLKNYKMVITQAYRSIDEQNNLYAKGRTQAQLDKVGLSKVKAQPNEKVVTQAKGGKSLHNFGLAVDFALVDSTGKKFVWDTKSDFDKDGKADWMEVVQEAKKLGFEYGGDWEKFKDMSHFQMTGGLDEKDIFAGKKPVFKVETPVKKPIVTPPVTPTKPKGAIGIATISVDKLNVRKESNGDSDVVKVVSRGESFKVYETNGDWLCLGKGMWINKKYVTYHKI
jgi:peptidoglycan L-alanyl-D-glutamate endopeptidase CwlK